jgi:hypothetical protein
MKLVLRAPVATHQSMPRGEFTLETEPIHDASVRKVFGLDKALPERCARATVQPLHMDPRTRALLKVNIDDILAAVGWPPGAALRAVVGRLVRGPALRFAREMTTFDDEIGRSGIRIAAGALLSAFVRDIRVTGMEHIPLRGPVLILSNHPGMTDTLALIASIPREDLLVLAAERPFLRALRAASRSLIYIPDEKAKRLAAVRRAVDHLRAGGALLTFPAGDIEPDPAVLPGAAEALGRWSASSLLFLRFVPECTVVPVVVSGVLARPAQQFPLTRLRRKRVDRERMAAMLQVLVHTLLPSAWRVRVRVDVLAPRAARDFPRSENRARAVLTSRVAEFLLRHGRA